MENMSKHGEITAEIGKSLKFEGYDIFYDHGTSSKNVGKIVSTLEKEYHRGDELSQLDIAIVEQNSDKVAVLVEIEETSDRPKTFLGDIFGVLFGEHICFKGKELKVGEFTTLIVVGVSKTNHKDRNEHILDQVNKVKANLGTLNARIGKVAIEIYANERKMKADLPCLLDRAFTSLPLIKL
jgi:hypothetical protein